MYHSGEDKMQIEKAKDLMTRDKKMNHIRIDSEEVFPPEDMQRSTSPPGIIFEAMLTVVSLPIPPHTVTLESGSSLITPEYRSGVGSPGMFEVGVRRILQLVPSGKESSKEVLDSQVSFKGLSTSAKPLGVGHDIF